MSRTGCRSSRSSKCSSQNFSPNPTYPVISIGQYIGESRYSFHIQDLSYIRLHDFLDSIHAPLYSFDILLELLREEVSSGRLNTATRHPSRKSFLRKLTSVFGNGCKPKKTTVMLENDLSYEARNLISTRDYASVFVFDAETQLRSILSDLGILIILLLTHRILSGDTRLQVGGLVRYILDSGMIMPTMI